MTTPTSGGSSDRRTGTPAPGDERAEQVLSQALRVMAGGRRADADGPGDAASGPWWDRATTSFLITLAVLVGLVVGGLAGFGSLLW